MKACPVVLRHAGEWQILAFEHPLAGVQLVKGSVEPGESFAQAALRELLEESGIRASRIVADLGLWSSGHLDQVWSFQLCEVAQALPETWTYHTADDAGHDFRFFWHPLEQSPTDAWHSVFRNALAYLFGQRSSMIAASGISVRSQDSPL